MKPRPLWKISVTTSAEAEEAVLYLFESVFGEPASSSTNLQTGTIVISAYLPWKPGRAKAGELNAGLKRIRASDLGLKSLRVTRAKVPPQNWAESWKRHFKPIEVSPLLLIKPSWSRRRSRKGQAVLVLDPGLSFGTGHHPTTGFCLRQLAAHSRPGQGVACLDLGTGSGILALAAARLGYEPIEAIDIDSEAIRVARTNARRNHLEGSIRFQQADAEGWLRRGSGQYSIICANLVSNLLLHLRERLLARLRADGALVLAGILKSEFPTVQRAYESAGLRLLASRTENEWRSGSFGWHK
jgi:ribosomal protein L11 methyltransferase